MHARTLPALALAALAALAGCSAAHSTTPASPAAPASVVKADGYTVVGSGDEKLGSGIPVEWAEGVNATGTVGILVVTTRPGDVNAVEQGIRSVSMDSTTTVAGDTVTRVDLDGTSDINSTLSMYGWNS